MGVASDFPILPGYTSAKVAPLPPSLLHLLNLHFEKYQPTFKAFQRLRVDNGPQVPFGEYHYKQQTLTYEKGYAVRALLTHSNENANTINPDTSIDLRSTCGEANCSPISQDARSRLPKWVEYDRKVSFFQLLNQKENPNLNISCWQRSEDTYQEDIVKLCTLGLLGAQMVCILQRSRHREC
jgi:hypothetical protein